MTDLMFLSRTRKKARPWFLSLFLILAICGARADDTAKIAALFSAVGDQGGLVTIPPGDYHLDGAAVIPISSHTTVSAYGARFHLPKTLGDKARVVLFQGENVRDFRWFGGHFTGRVFDPQRSENSWEPNANTRAILITTTAGGQTENLTFRDITSDGVAGAVITVLGAPKPGSEREILTFARNVSLENCTLERSGKFMWDYGYLWQITVWPEDYSAAERAMAARYFRNDLIHGPVRMDEGDDRVFFNNQKLLPVSKVREGAEARRGYETICFFGDKLPANLVRGRQYFVIDSQPDFVRISEQPGGAVIRFATAAGPETKLIENLFRPISPFTPRRAAGRAREHLIWWAVKMSSSAGVVSARLATPCIYRKVKPSPSPTTTSPVPGWGRFFSPSIAGMPRSPGTRLMGQMARGSSAWKSPAKT